MHIQFAPAAFRSVSDGEASNGDAAYAAWSADGATITGEAQGERWLPLFVPFDVTLGAPFIQDNEKFVFQASEFQSLEFHARTSPRCAAVAAVSVREMSARTGVAFFKRDNFIKCVA